MSTIFASNSNIASPSTSNKKTLIVDDLHPAFAEAAEKPGYACTIDASFTKGKTLKVIADIVKLRFDPKGSVNIPFI